MPHSQLAVLAQLYTSLNHVLSRCYELFLMVYER